jgi:hypothetical protein
MCCTSGGLGPGDAPTNLIVSSINLSFDDGNSMMVRRRLQADEPSTPMKFVWKERRVRIRHAAAST